MELILTLLIFYTVIAIGLWAYGIIAWYYLVAISIIVVPTLIMFILWTNYNSNCIIESKCTFTSKAQVTRLSWKEITDLYKINPNRLSLNKDGILFYRSDNVIYVIQLSALSYLKLLFHSNFGAKKYAKINEDIWKTASKDLERLKKEHEKKIAEIKKQKNK